MDNFAIQSLFPTPIGHAKLDRAITEKELDFINSLEKIRNEGNLISSNKNILDSEELLDIKKFIEINLNRYFQEVYSPKPQDEIEIYLTISWANYTSFNQYHHPHTHGNSFISGCFYPQVTDGDTITFEISKYNTFEIRPTSFNLWNSRTWTINVEPGHLIFFPSSLTHLVQRKEQDATRVSIAFNSFLRGKFGVDGGADRLILM